MKELVELTGNHRPGAILCTQFKDLGAANQDLAIRTACLILQSPQFPHADLATTKAKEGQGNNAEARVSSRNHSPLAPSTGKKEKSGTCIRDIVPKHAQFTHHQAYMSLEVLLKKQLIFFIVSLNQTHAKAARFLLLSLCILARVVQSGLTEIWKWTEFSFEHNMLCTSCRAVKLNVLWKWCHIHAVKDNFIPQALYTTCPLTVKATPSASESEHSYSTFSIAIQLHIFSTVYTIIDLCDEYWIMNVPFPCMLQTCCCYGKLWISIVSHNNSMIVAYRRGVHYWLFHYYNPIQQTSNKV